jgi:hypothetical protein
MPRGALSVAPTPNADHDADDVGRLAEVVQMSVATMLPPLCGVSCPAMNRCPVKGLIVTYLAPISLSSATAGDDGYCAVEE